MLFNSYEFLLFFLPAVLVGYFALGGYRLASRLHGNDRLAIAFLVAASFFFYAWWRAEYVWLLAVSIAVNYSVGRAIVRGAARQAPTQTLLVLGIAFDLILLGYFKYANFFLDNVASLAGAVPLHLDVILPIGISFFTFTQIAFLVDAAKGKAAEPDPLNYSLFVTYFPHLLAGPILHHREMMPQFADPTTKRVDWDNVARGLVLLAIGLGKKVLIADTLALQANDAFGSVHPITFGDAWLGILCYTLQIYFDFSGYTDMARGLAQIMGFRLMLNFNNPYVATGLG
ncbi:MAG TPA: MBOAT family O-acyltransferase, partial [Usitatibacter sp.]|nr:MBOAT family O-acyltransferase [Usitatibacter sp.]